MLPITLFLAFILESTKTTDFIILSFVAGILVELYQYINHAKVKYKTVDNQYIKFALFDIFITVVAGTIGSLFFNFLNFYIQ